MRLHIEGWTLELNSVGSSADRARYNEVLRAALIPVAPRMCADCQRRAVTNPLRVLDCKVPEDQPIIDSLPKITDSLDQESKDHFAQVTAALDAAGVAYRLNPRLVRGLDYYTRTTFEFTHGGLGAQNALLGGGRYDGLSEAIGGPKAPGIGFAMGLDRLVLTLQAQEAAQAAAAAAPKADAYVAPLGEKLNAAALALARELRRAGLSVELGDGSFRLKKSFEAADKVARRIVILGEDELQFRYSDSEGLCHGYADQGFARGTGELPQSVGANPLGIAIPPFRQKRNTSARSWGTQGMREIESERVALCSTF